MNNKNHIINITNIDKKCPKCYYGDKEALEVKNRLLEVKKFLLYNEKSWPKTPEEIIELVQKNDRVRYSDVSLENFYDTFITWYQGTIEGTQIRRQEKTKVVEKLINKMAIWFEFKYTKNRIVELIPCYEGRKNKDGTAPGEELMSIEQFYKALSPEERELLKVPAHQKNVHFDNQGKDYFCVDTEGKIIGVEGDLQSLIPENKRGIINDKRLIGMDLIEANELFKSEGIFITIPQTKQERKLDNAEIIMTTLSYQHDLAVYNGILDSVMAKIIDNGGPILGPRRGLLFAEEFGRNLNFPMLYAHNQFDSNSMDLVNYFINNSGQSSIPCVSGYFDSLTHASLMPTCDLKSLQPINTPKDLQLSMTKDTKH